MRVVLGHEPMHSTFSSLLNNQPVLLEDAEILDCPVCPQVFRRNCLMKVARIHVQMHRWPLSTEIRFWVCTSMHPEVAVECGFVVPVSFSDEERAELAAQRVAYLKEWKKRH